MVNRLCPGSLDWDTYWSLNGEQLSALSDEFNAQVKALEKRKR